MQARYKGLKVPLPQSPEFVEFQVDLLLDGRPLSPTLLQLCIGILLIAQTDYRKRSALAVPGAGKSERLLGD